MEEPIYWLELLAESQTVPVDKPKPLLNEAGELIAILTTIDKKVKLRSR